MRTTAFLALVGADPERICLSSYSAGGPLLSNYMRQPRPFVRCLAAFYSILDIRTSEIHSRYMTPDKLALFSPAAQLSEHAATVPQREILRAANEFFKTHTAPKS